MYKANIPLVKLIPRDEYKQPWMTEDIRELQQEKYRLNKLVKERKPKKDAPLWTRYTTVRNRVTSLTRIREKEYYSNQIEDARGDQKKTWKVLRSVIGSSKKKSDLPTKVTVEGVDTDCIKTVFNTLNDFFSEVGSELAKKIPNIIF